MTARLPLPMRDPRRRHADAFTLLEILLASMAAAIVLAALYGIFIHAIKLRDNATDRVRDARLRARAESVIRTDLQSALISGGIIAASLEGGTNNNGGPGGASLPGYLKFTTTTGRDTGSDLYGDVQQVEYYLEHDPDAPAAADNKGANVLVRAVTRDLLSSGTAAAHEEQVLHGVQSLAVEFYDGANWQQTWNYDSAAAALTNGGNDATSGTVISFGNTTLPDAVRVNVQQAAATANGHLPPPVEVLVPWTTQPFAAATPSAAISTVSATATPLQSPSISPEQRPGGGPGSGPPPPGGQPPNGGLPPNRPPPAEPPPSGGRPPPR